MAPSEYRQGMRNLNAGQRQVVMCNRAWCKKTVHALQKGEITQPYKLFPSGPGGTGKCFVSA